MVALTGRDCVGLRDRVLADRLEDQITSLIAHVLRVDAGLPRAGLSGIETQPDVVVAVGLGSFRIDGSGQLDAGGKELKSVGAVNVSVGITNADGLADTEAGRRRRG